MNYSETYFELDSEEATHCDHCHLIWCVYIKGHVETVDTKDQSNAIVYWEGILFVDTVDTYTGVCGSYTTPFAGVKYLQKVASRPCQEGRLLYCVSLPSWGFSCSPVSPRRQLLLTFLDLSKLQGWLQARRTANPQFLKLKGAQQPGNSYISMGTKLHPPHSNKLPACTEFWSESVFSAWRPWACTIPLELAGSVLCKVCSHEQVDVPIHRLQHQMLGCQVTQTRLSLIAHTWPWFYLSRSCTPCVPPAQLTNKTSLGMTDTVNSLKCNFNVDTVDTAKNTSFTQWNLRANWSNRLENLGHVNTVDTGIQEIPIQDRCQQRSKSWCGQVGQLCKWAVW